MSLRRYDDWDEALDEAQSNSIKRKNVTPPNYDYGASIVISLDEIQDGGNMGCSKGKGKKPPKK